VEAAAALLVFDLSRIERGRVKREGGKVLAKRRRMESL
jgi:hypothetical protein